MLAVEKSSLQVISLREQRHNLDKILLCKDLKDGMLVRINDPQFCAWFNYGAHQRLLNEWKEIPPRVRVGSIAIGMLAGSSIVTQNDTIVYVGSKMVESTGGDKRRQIRLLLVNGSVGFIEGFDVKYLEPVV